MGWMSQLRLQQLTEWQAAGDGRGSATVEGGLEREREVDGGRCPGCGRGEVPRGSWRPGLDLDLDWTRLEGTGRVNLGRCLSVQSPVS